MSRHWLFAGLLIGMGFSTIGAQEVPTEPPADAAVKETAPAKAEDAGPEPMAATPEQLQQLIQDLVNPKFAVRQAASQKLAQSGKPGMEAVAQAATTDDLELATRCLAVLTEGLASKTQDVSQTAKKSLQELAKSENKSVAQRARVALEANAPQNPAGFPGGPRNFQQIRVNVVNGVREINVQQNGTETIIKDTNGKEITVTTNETVDGKKVSKTVTGKDLEDLKKNHPDAHAMVEKFGKGGAGGQIQFGINLNGNRPVAFGQVPGLQVARPNRLRMIHPIKAANAFDEIDQLGQKLAEANEKLAKSAESDKPDPAELKAISAEIKTLAKRLTEIKGEVQLP